MRPDAIELLEDTRLILALSELAEAIRSGGPIPHDVVRRGIEALMADIPRALEVGCGIPGLEERELLRHAALEPDNEDDAVRRLMAEIEDLQVRIHDACDLLADPNVTRDEVAAFLRLYR
ncbi:hypothetical protein KA093_01520 [Candidatus Saccharibacteria bacterium]|nr:hypothetical protein [Candidatus Saccharibacteria bacterium]